MWVWGAALLVVAGGWLAAYLGAGRHYKPLDWREERDSELCLETRRKLLDLRQEYARKDSQHYAELARADGLAAEVEVLDNACEQALLLLERDRYADDGEANVVRAVLRGALGRNE